ncbi:MAG TPA: MerR family transcriptional regulator [Anaerolineae bacterium]|nr:MerR family transcriptional regulator [Anaerolineae bacterium]HIQ06459.1 MerR family transcriptional regulator [Anaerolineae bacterium]
MTLMALIRHQEDAPQFTQEVAAQLAGLSLARVRYYERLGLVSPKVMPGGGRGYSWRDVRRLARIRRLREDLGLDLPAIEVVLHLRRQVLDLQQQLDYLEIELARREETLLREIQLLRRQLAEEAHWRV